MKIAVYVMLVASVFWLQLKLMKKSAKKKDYIAALFIVSVSAVVGLCLTMGISVVSPTLILQKWLSAFVK